MRFPSNATRGGSDFRAFVVLTCLLIASAGSIPLLSAQEDLEPEELIQRHLESIASPDLLSERETFVLRGESRFRILSGEGQADVTGPAQFVSEGKKLNFLLDFGLGDYGGEQFITDGDRAATAYSTPGTRYPLAEFLFSQDSILKEALFGGVLTTAWSLIDLEERDPRLDLEGLEEVEDRELIELDYGVRRGGDLRVKLYFDPETYRHVLTTYDMRYTAALGANPADSARQRSTRVRLEEEFGDFQDFNGYTLPASWTIRFSQQGTGQGLLHQYTIQWDQSAANQEIPPTFFEVP